MEELGLTSGPPHSNPDGKIQLSKTNTKAHIQWPRPFEILLGYKLSCFWGLIQAVPSPSNSLPKQENPTWPPRLSLGVFSSPKEASGKSGKLHHLNLETLSFTT